MSKTLLTALVAAGLLGATASAQTTPAGTTATRVDPARKTGPAVRGTAGSGNSGDTAPNRSTTAGDPTAATSNNPVDATGKPVGTAQPTGARPGKARKPKN